ncbi:MAG: DUF7144 family membrane protein [Nocardioidaceae bacterium]
MSETPQAEKTGAAQVPPQTRGQEEMTATQVPPQHRSETPAPETTAWVGWVVFAATIMAMVGAFQVIVGLVAVFDSGYYAVNENGLVVNVDYTGWGWVHMGLGAVAIAAAIGLLAGQMWARVVGIAMALVSAIVNLAFIAAYPLWSITVIALDVVVVYAIAMHGKELKTERL